MNKYSPNFLTIEELTENKTYTIPVYQRPYSWTKNEVVVLLEDINESFKNDESLFIGTLYAKNLGTERGQIHRYELIDGQQRIITLSFIFLVIYSIIISDGFIDDNSIEKSKIRNILWKYISRENQREYHLVYSKAIEKTMLKSVFEYGYDQINELKEYILNYQDSASVESNIKEVFREIFKFIEYNFKTTNEILDFTDYILRRISVILIETNVSSNAVFKMFEAINSKGKRLEDIDLIKTFIFSQLEEKDYDQYLNKWGYLIKETDDMLEDYLWVYVKSFIKYYTYSVKINSFKSMINDEATFKFYNLEKPMDTLKIMINDLVDKVKYYKALNNVNSFLDITNKKQILVQYYIFQNMDYQHPKPLILRALYEFDKSEKNNSDIENLENIFKVLNSYMIIFQTLNNRDSKDSIDLIRRMLSESYKRKKLDANHLKQLMADKMISEKLDVDNFILRFKELEGYKRSATDIGFVMLVINESYNEEEKFFSHDNANSLFKSKNLLSLDHLLVQNPKANSNFFYYQDKTILGDEVVKLKEGSDFPEGIINGMLYDDFKSRVLNKIGNLRIVYRDKNSQRGNTELKLLDNQEFTKYQQIENRTEKMIDNILKSNIFYIPRKEDVTPPEDTDNFFILDFNNLESATKKKPRLVRINDSTYEIDSNKELLKAVLSFLYHMSGEVMINIAEGKKGHGSVQKPWISFDEKKLRNPEKIEKSELYFEANKSAVEILKFIIRVFEEDYGLDIKNIEIIYSN